MHEVQNSDQYSQMKETKCHGVAEETKLDAVVPSLQLHRLGAE